MSNIPDPILNSATISYEYTVDPSLADVSNESESNTVTTRVQMAELGITKQTDKVYADLYEIITYTLLVANTGNTAADNVTIKDPIPTKAEFVIGSVKINGITMPLYDPNAGFNIGSVAAGQDVTVVFQVKAVEGGVLTNTAAASYNYTIDPSSPDSESENITSNSVDTNINFAQLDYENGAGFVKTEDRTVVENGDTIKYSFVIINTGNVSADNVVFKDLIPNGCTFVKNSMIFNDAARLGSPDMGISLGNLAPGVRNTLSYSVTVTSEPSVNPIPNFATITYLYTVNPSRPDAVQGSGKSNTVYASFIKAGIDEDGFIKGSNTTAATTGDIITYSFTINNKYDVDLKNVVLHESIPDNTEFIGSSVTINSVPYILYDPKNGISIGTLSAKTSAVITFKVKIISLPKDGKIKNIANASYSYTVDPNYPDIEKDIDSNEIIIEVKEAKIDNSDNGYIKIADKAYAQIGDNITYTLVLKNTGNVTANNVAITDPLPSNVSFVANSVIINGVPVPNVNSLTNMVLGNIEPNQSAVVEFKVLVTSKGTDGFIKNSATTAYNYIVDSAKPPVNGSGKTNEVQTIVQSVDFSGDNFKKIGSPRYVLVGDILSYSFVIKNDGNAAANNAVFKDVLPSSLALVEGSIFFDGLSLAMNNLASGIPLGNLLPGVSHTLKFNVKVLSLPEVNPVVNTGSLDYTTIVDPTKPPVDGHSESEPSENIIKNVKVDFNKIPDKTNVLLGDIITYSITAKNTGDTDVKNIFVVDNLGDELLFVPNSVTIDGVSYPDFNITTGFDIEGLEIGESKVISFKAKVTSLPENKTVLNKVHADITYILDPDEPPRTKPEESNETDIKVQDASLEVTKSTDAECVKLNDIINYTITVKNTGTVADKNIIIYDTLSKQLEFVNSSITLNGKPILNAIISSGINIGTLNPGETAVVQYQVKVTGVAGCNGFVANTAYAKYRYALIEGGEELTETTEPISVETSAAHPTFRQISLDSCFDIPCVKPDIDDINHLKSTFEITNYQVIKTAKGKAEDNMILTGSKLLISGEMTQIVEYTADDELQSVHSAHFKKSFSTFIILPENVSPSAKIKFISNVEDVYYKAISNRQFFSNITLNIIAIITKNC